MSKAISRNGSVTAQPATPKPLLLRHPNCVGAKGKPCGVALELTRQHLGLCAACAKALTLASIKKHGIATITKTPKGDRWSTALPKERSK